MQRGEGSGFRARLDCLRVVHGNAPPRLRITLADFSELARIRQALEESEERNRLIVESSDEAIVFVDPDGRILSANPAACAVFGYSEAEICHLSRADLIDASDPPRT